jgi:hypothetical protein
MRDSMIPKTCNSFKKQDGLPAHTGARWRSCPLARLAPHRPRTQAPRIFNDSDASSLAEDTSSRGNPTPPSDPPNHLYCDEPALAERLTGTSAQPLPFPPPPPHPAPTDAKDPPSWPSAAAREALYSAVPTERVDGLYAKVSGTLPPWLRGSLYRNGPGAFCGVSTVFDGPAMLARFAIDGPANTVVVSHRFLETTYLRAAGGAGGEVRWGLGQLHPGHRRSHLGRLCYLASLGLGTLTHGRDLGDNALVSVFYQASCFSAFYFFFCSFALSFAYVSTKFHSLSFYLPFI